MLQRRSLAAMLALLPFAAHATSARAASGSGLLPDAAARGPIDAVKEGLQPGASVEQGASLQAVIDRAASAGSDILLPPGDYRVSGLQLRRGTRLAGVAGATRLIHAGEGAMVSATGVEGIGLSGITLVGAPRAADSGFRALADFRGVKGLAIDDCTFIASPRTALQLEACSGRIERSLFTGAALYGIYALDSAGLSITGNVVEQCGDGGILVHRAVKGNDATIITGNRISRIRAMSGGTGQYGNGINLFRANNVLVSGNHISGCAFSAIRANAASDVIINANHCLASGETAIYSEFGFEGAIVSANIVDGAANGISVVNFNDGGRLATITGNVVRKLSLSGPYPPEGPGFGIGIAAEADTVVSANTIEGAPSWGMLIGWGPYLRNVSVSGNVIRNAATAIAVTVVEGAGMAMISGNLFDSAPGGGIVGYRHRERATQDMTDGGSPGHLVIAGNRLVSG